MVTMSYHQRKQARKAYFEQFVKGWKLDTCVACNGSGRYDDKGSPKCSGCNGTGKVRKGPSKVP